MNTGPSFLYLSRADVEAIRLPVADVIAAVENALRDKAEGNVEMPPKPGIHPVPDSFIHAMPAYLKARGAAGLKWVSGYPSNQAKGLPYISGLLILNDPETGFPIAVMDAAWITAVRTGAATAVAAKYLARPASASLAILGCGVQGRSNTEALLTVLPSLRAVYAYDISPEAAARFRDECSGRYPVSCTVCDTPEAAVRPSDVIVTAGPILRNPSPVIRPEWLRPGAFLCTLDFDSYVTAAAFASADLQSTDDVPQFRHYREIGFFGAIPDDPVDLGRIVAGTAARRTSEQQRIVSVNLGLAAEDIAVAQILYRRALESGRGVKLPL